MIRVCWLVGSQPQACGYRRPRFPARPPAIPYCAVLSDQSSILAAVRPIALAADGQLLIEEFWIPQTRERADLVAVGDLLSVFEIKSSRDTLRRLPRQILAFDRVFDHCTAVLDSRHLAGADDVPEHWGLLEVSDELADPCWHRRPRSNLRVDPELLVQLLWKAEAAALLERLGMTPPTRSTRQVLWRLLMGEATGEQIRQGVRHALLTRDPSTARIDTRRFKQVAPVGD